MEFTYVSGTWLLYAAACLLLVGFLFQAPRMTMGAAGLTALLVQQALATVAGVLIFTTDSPTLLIQTFRQGVYAWLLWSPLVFLCAPLLLAGSPLRRYAWPVAIAGSVPTVALILWSFVEPEGIVQGGVRLTSFAAGCLLLVFIAFATTSGFLAWEALTTPAPLRQAQFALMSAAFALEGAFHAAQNVGKLFVTSDFHGLAAASGTEKVFAILAGVAFLALAAGLGAHSIRASTPKQRRWARILMSCIIVAGTTGVVTSRLISGEEFRDPSGLFHAVWDLAGLSLLVFAGLRYQLFDIEMRARQAIVVGSLVVIGLGTFAVVENLAENFLQEQYFAGLPAAGSVAALFVAATSTAFLKIGKQVAQTLLPNVGRTEDYEARRAEEIYAAALEGAFLDGIVSPSEARSIRSLREKLGIADEAHVRIEAKVRAQIAAATPAAPPAAVA